MPGAKLQIASRGSVDDVLTGKPDISFFNVTTKRPTRFALELMPVSFNSTADFGTKTSITIPRSGDMLHSLWLQLTVPDLSLYQPSGGGVTLPTSATNIAWCNSIGLALPASVEMDFGGAAADTITSEYIDVWSELTLKDEKRQGFNEMIGRYDDYDNTDPTKSSSCKRTYYFPCQFYFQNESTNAVPLCCMPNTPLTFNVTFRPFLACIKSSVASVISMVDAAGNPPTLSAECYCEQVFLGPVEKNVYMTRPMEYPITTHQMQEEQVLKVTTSSVQTGSLIRRFSLNFTGPVKEIIWTYVTSARGSINSLTGNDWFNYSLPAPFTQNPFDSMTLYVNGSQRQAPLSGDWYRIVTNLEKHNRVPINRKMIMTFPFSLAPMDEAQPSGSANFTRLTNPYVSYVMNKNIDNGTIRMWAPSWQVLRVNGGLAQLVYSSS